MNSVLRAFSLCGVLIVFCAFTMEAAQVERSAAGAIENIKNCGSFEGASAGIKIGACIAALANTGGVADASDLHGQQLISNDIFASTSKPIILKLSAATYTVATSFTIPNDVTIVFGEGAVFSVTAGNKLIYRGGISALPIRIFAGNGSVLIASSRIPQVYPQWWGAEGDGVTDDTRAINMAIESLAAPSIVYFSPGLYLLTDTVNVKGGAVALVGAGQHSTRLKFNPSRDTAAIRLQSEGRSAIAQDRIAGFTFDGSGNTDQIKTAIQIIDAEELEISDIAISNWSDSKHQSTGVDIEGRQALIVTRATVNADLPFRIRTDPNTSIVAADHYVFRDIYTIANPNQPNFKIDDGVWLTDVTWAGYQAWVSGSYGIYWNDSTAASESYGIHIQNARWEQSNNTAGYALYLAPHHFSYALTISGVYSDSGHNGFYIRNFRSGSLTDSFYEGLSDAINLDSSSGIAVAHNFFNLNAGARISTKGFSGIWCNNDAPGYDVSRSQCSFDGSSSVNPLLIPNSSWVASRANDGVTELQMIGADRSNNIQIAPSSAQTFIGGTLGVGGTFPHEDYVSIPNSKCYGGQDPENKHSIPILCIDSNGRIQVAPHGTEIYTSAGTLSFAGTSQTGRTFRTGTGNPNGTTAGNIGDIYLNTSGGNASTLYVKESGSGTVFGWVGK